MAWNTFKNHFSTIPDIPPFAQSSRSEVCDIGTLQIATVEGTPIVDLIPKKVQSSLRKKLDSSILVPEDELSFKTPHLTIFGPLKPKIISIKKR